MRYNAQIIAKTRKDLVTLTRLAYARGLSSGTSGNPSARVPGSPELVLIKSTGSCFGLVEPEDFVLVDLDGNLLEGECAPSKEVYFHCGIYKLRPEVGAVFHGHSAYTTAYASKKGAMPYVTAAANGNIKTPAAIVEFAPAGSKELAEMVINAFKDKNTVACILKTHGFVTVGKDIHQAYYFGDILEDNAKVACIMDTLK